MNHIETYWIDEREEVEAFRQEPCIPYTTWQFKWVKSQMSEANWRLVSDSWYVRYPLPPLESKTEAE